MNSDIVQQALTAWGYPAQSPVALIGDSNNTVYRVDLPDGAAVLRVHRPNHKTRAWIKAELRLLHHLSAAGLAVPRPLADVIEVRDAGGTAYFCTLLSHVEGAVKPVENWYALLANHAGLLLGKIHRAARTFALTPDVDRPRLDAATLFSQSTQYALDDEGEALLAPYAPIFARVQAQAAAAFDTLAGLGVGLQPIHGDYRPDNVLWARLVPAAVDFDDCAWGSPAYDMATLWLFLRPHPRYEQLKMYAARAWCVAFGIDDSPILFPAVEALVAARVALSCRWVAGNLAHPNYAGRAADLIRERLSAL